MSLWYETGNLFSLLIEVIGSVFTYLCRYGPLERVVIETVFYCIDIYVSITNQSYLLFVWACMEEL